MKHFPIFTQLNNRVVLIVGGGQVALRKLLLLKNAGANIELVAKELHPEIRELVDTGEVKWIGKAFDADQLDKVFLVVAATDNSALNEKVATEADKKFRLCNVVDNPKLCSYIMPSIIDRGNLQVAISTGGHAPVLARLWREKLEAILPHHLEMMTQISGKWRSQIKTHFTHLTQRRRFWETLFSHREFIRHCDIHNEKQANSLISDMLQQDVPIKGEVTLVGAGPGDPELLTLKGLRYIQQADVILYDALVSPQILELVRRDADKIFVGKRASNHAKRQEEINRLLVEQAKLGKRVVRLKGGDPFVFGRGGEELETLIKEKIDFSVIPGVTAGVGATAYAGIPLTHRNYAQSATFITGHGKLNGQDIEWDTLAMSNHTLVVYMGTLKANVIAQCLIDNGRKPETPVAVISHGTLPEQQVLTGQLKQLDELAQKAPRPALIVIGEIVKLREQLTWFK